MAIVIAIATTIAIFVMILIAITMAIAITMTIDDCQGHLVTYEGLQKHSQGNKAWLVGDLTMLRKHVTTVQTSKKHPKTCVVYGGNTYSNCGLCGGYAFFSHEGWFRSRNCFIATKLAILSSLTCILCTVLVMRGSRMVRIPLFVVSASLPWFVVVVVFDQKMGCSCGCHTSVLELGNNSRKNKCRH